MTAITAPIKRISEYSRYTKDYGAYVTIDGNEEYLGSRKTQHDADVLADNYIYDYLHSGLTRSAVEMDGGAPEWEAVTLVEPSLNEVAPIRADLARAAFHGQNEALMSQLLILDGYTLDGTEWPSNGMSLARAIELMTGLTDDEFSYLVALGVVAGGDVEAVVESAETSAEKITTRTDYNIHTRDYGAYVTIGNDKDYEECVGTAQTNEDAMRLCDEYIQKYYSRKVPAESPTSLCGAAVWPTPAYADPPLPDEPTPANEGDEPPIGWGECEAIRTEALAMLEAGADYCTVCGLSHLPTRCPQVGALLMAGPHPNGLYVLRAAHRTALANGRCVEANFIMDEAAILAEAFVCGVETIEAAVVVA